MGHIRSEPNFNKKLRWYLVEKKKKERRYIIFKYLEKRGVTYRIDNLYKSNDINFEISVIII